MKPTVFLDRDGVINRRIVGDYVTCLSEFEILEGVLEAIAELNKAGYRTVVVTNQRGIAIGRMSRDDVDRVHQYLAARVSEMGGALNEFFICPHDRDQGCPCRKPEAGLLDQADLAEPVDWQRSWLIGDSDSDIEAAHARNVRTIKVAGPSKASPHFLAENLPLAVACILAQT